MYNLSQGIRENATDHAISGIIVNMYRKGYASEQITEIVETSVEEVKAVIKKKTSTGIIRQLNKTKRVPDDPCCHWGLLQPMPLLGTFFRSCRTNRNILDGF